MCCAKAGTNARAANGMQICGDAYAWMHMRRFIADMRYADVPTKSSQVLVYGCCRRRRMRLDEISITACIYYGAEGALYM